MMTSRPTRRAFMRAGGASLVGLLGVATGPFSHAPSRAMAASRHRSEEPTLRQLADAAGVRLSVLAAEFNDLAKLDDAAYVQAVEAVANQLSIGLPVQTQYVFGWFNRERWRLLLDNWSVVREALDHGQVPARFFLSWNRADALVSFAEARGMRVRGQSLLWGADVLDSLYDGDFTNEELYRILEFMVKTRVRRYRGRIREWLGVSEAGAHLVFGTADPKRRFWYDRFGTDVMDAVFFWAKEVDPDATLVVAENGVDEPDAEQFRRIREKFFELLRHFREAGVPADSAELEENLWIYAPPPSDHLRQTLREIQGMGYGIAACEMTVNIDRADPFWTDRRTSATIADPLAAQAQVYRDVLGVYLEVGADFGLGGLSDATGWLARVGFPQTKAMIFDEQLRPKPAYFALRDTLLQVARVA